MATSFLQRGPRGRKGSLGYDWKADSSVIVPLVAADWTDVNGIDTGTNHATVLTSGPTLVNGRIRATVDTDKLSGMYRAMPDGNFRRLMRVEFNKAGSYEAATTHWVVSVAFIDGADLDANWFGWGVYGNGASAASWVGAHHAHNSSGWGSWTQTASSGSPRGSFEIMVERVSTSLYFFPKFGGLFQGAPGAGSLARTVSATGGLLAFRIQSRHPTTAASSTHGLVCDLTHYGVYPTDATWPI